MTLPRCIMDPAWEQPRDRMSPRAGRPGLMADGCLHLGSLAHRRAVEDADLIRLLLATWDRLPVVVASTEERDRIAARLTAGELARVDWLDEWPQMEG